MPAPLFQPAAQPQPTAVGLPAGPTVNGWFKTAFDGDSVAVIWPVDDGEKWATATPAPATQVGLPRRVPQPHLVPEAQQPSADPRRKLDPAAVSAAMSAYAKGVAGRRSTTSF
ncbi:hypothetical protein ENC19_07300 [Verrucosispora sp. CWR15]|uniref:Uncharacterized protein n=1 Tax=Verrucosispora sioxanthis TaxID=2499994 RepID=A0A6M1KUP8_9ACTN|nr:hypothetical protein [Verrucosispora sioxanthis]NEE63366.1 hypothetical protein [Verrucosispora sioxanthis]NGM12476.1 hypothetical protein [Verrucosispora sioxanthis]